jgi:LysM repeat protein
VPGQTPIPTFTPFPIVTSPATAAPGVTSTAPVSVIDLRGPTVNGIGTYIVLPGDNFEAIARRYGVTVQTLAALNGILNPRNIVIGQVLAVPGPGNNVPGGTVAPTIIPTVPGGSGVSGRVHVVQVGDNLFRISLRYGVTIEALLRANNLANANLIYVGQRLRIP